MSVYVDEITDYPRETVAPSARPFGTRWCHLTADTPEELHAFAARLGLKRAWFQGRHARPQLHHYDLTPSKRALALDLGAEFVSAREQAHRLIDAGIFGSVRPLDGPRSDEAPA